MRQFELEHGPEGEEEDGDVTGGVEDVGRVHEVDGGEAEPETLLEGGDDPLQAVVVR